MGKLSLKSACEISWLIFLLKYAALPVWKIECLKISHFAFLRTTTSITVNAGDNTKQNKTAQKLRDTTTLATLTIHTATLLGTMVTTQVTTHTATLLVAATMGIHIPPRVRLNIHPDRNLTGAGGKRDFWTRQSNVYIAWRLKIAEGLRVLINCCDSTLSNGSSTYVCCTMFLWEFWFYSVHMCKKEILFVYWRDNRMNTDRSDQDLKYKRAFFYFYADMKYHFHFVFLSFSF